MILDSVVQGACLESRALFRIYLFLSLQVQVHILMSTSSHDAIQITEPSGIIQGYEQELYYRKTQKVNMRIEIQITINHNTLVAI